MKTIFSFLLLVSSVAFSQTTNQKIDHQIAVLEKYLKGCDDVIKLSNIKGDIMQIGYRSLDAFGSDYDPLPVQNDKLKMYKATHENYRLKGIEAQSKVFNVEKLYKASKGQYVVGNIVLDSSDEKVAQLVNYCFHLQYLFKNEYIPYLKSLRK